jgi:hypothetical protein
MRAALALLILVLGCHPRPEEYVACKKICEPMAWEVPRRGVCRCYPQPVSPDAGAPP